MQRASRDVSAHNSCGDGFGERIGIAVIVSANNPRVNGPVFAGWTRFPHAIPRPGNSRRARFIKMILGGLRIRARIRWNDPLTRTDRDVLRLLPTWPADRDHFACAVAVRGGAGPEKPQTGAR